MGANVYLEAVASFGYTAGTSGTAIQKNIDGVAGGRVSILAFGVTCGVAESLYFMTVLGTTTIDGAVASGITTCAFAGQPGPSGNLLASGDYLALVLSNGDFFFASVSNWWVSNFTAVLDTTLTDTIDDGAAVYNFGIFSDTGHFAYLLTANSQTTKSQDPGVFFGAAKGYPMKVWHPNTGSQPKSVDYVTVQYINK